VNISLDILFALCEHQKPVRVIGRKAIRAFAERHPDSGAALATWYMMTKRAAWKNLTETKSDFPATDLVGRRTVFNIKGNSYRLIARVNYQTQRVFILHILTHAEYNKEKWKK
jgi:mRNA interferase HigB